MKDTRELSTSAPAYDGAPVAARTMGATGVTVTVRAARPYRRLPPMNTEENNQDRYGALIERILEHPRYGPAMEEATGRGAALVLNYHSHQGNERYCVSICEKQEGAIELLDVGLANLRELVHVEGFGPGPEACLPLCGELSRALVRHYGLERSPLIYRDGEPLAAPGGSSKGDARR